MKRPDPLPFGASRGRGRRRTAPLQPFDTVPPELVEAAKRLFEQRHQTGPQTRGPKAEPSAGPVASEEGPNETGRFHLRQKSLTFSARRWKLSW